MKSNKSDKPFLEGLNDKINLAMKHKKSSVVELCIYQTDINKTHRRKKFI